ncbi:MAG TPA: hypothetical protein VF198_12070 [Vicinamibacterales bacterium]
MTATRSLWSLVPIVGAILVAWLLLHRILLGLYTQLAGALERVVTGPFA